MSTVEPISPVRTRALLLHVVFEHREVVHTTVFDKDSAETVTDRVEPLPDAYDVEYALRQLRVAFQVIWESYDLLHEDDYTKLGAVLVGRDQRFPLVQALEIGSLDSVLRIPAAIVGAPFAALMELLGSALELDIKIRNHRLRREKERLQLEIDVLELRKRYDLLAGDATQTALPRGKLSAVEAEVLEVPTGDG